MTLPSFPVNPIKPSLLRSVGGALTIFILCAASISLAAAEAFEGVITARRGGTVERYFIQGQKIRFESESAGRTGETVIVDFAAKKRFIILGTNTSLSYELWGDDLDP